MMGLTSVLEDEDTQRRELYGQAGCFRPKPYGVEYRTLSNYWLKSRELMTKIYERSNIVMDKVAAGQEIGDRAGKHIQSAINNSNKALAKDLLEKYKVV